jgi:hypothetical protein
MVVAEEEEAHTSQKLRWPARKSSAAAAAETGVVAAGT